jgi:hypothetical protein
MRCDYACGSDEHVLHRRAFLGTATSALGGVVAGLGAFGRPVMAKTLNANDRRVLVVNMAGGLSQLESWDPKPATATGGPFRAIPTSVPGIHISELLPMTARQMHHLTLVRGVNTSEDDHAKGAFMMTTGIFASFGSDLMSESTWRPSRRGRFRSNTTRSGVGAWAYSPSRRRKAIARAPSLTEFT